MTQLTDAQQSAVDELVSAGRLEKVPGDPKRVRSFLEQAENTLADIDNVTVAQNRSTLSYLAGHAAGEALLAAYGYRTTNRAGHHEALIRFMGIVLAETEEGLAVKHLERMRRARNQFQYEGRPPSETDADAAVQTAATLVAAVRGRNLA